MEIQKTTEELAANKKREFHGRFLWAFFITLLLCLMSFELLTNASYWFSYLPVMSLLLSILMGLLYGLYGPDRTS